MTKDYNETLAEGIEVIRDKVKRGMLPLVARNPALDKLTSEYALAQAEQYDAKKAAGKNPPIPYRDSNALDRCADLVLYEELTWSHPDKMSIVEYPIMSEDQEDEREAKYTPHDDLQYGDRRFLGRRKTHRVDESGTTSVRNSRVVIPYDTSIDRLESLIDLQDAIDRVEFTDRQREAIELVYFGEMTQEEASLEMGISQQAVASHLGAAIKKIREAMFGGVAR